MGTTTLLIGLGRGGSALLPYLLAKTEFDLVGVCDSNPDAVGVAIAKRCGLPFYQTAVNAVTDLRPDLVVDATGDPSLASTLYEVRPAGTSVVTGEASRLLWELLAVQEQQRRCELRFNRLINDMHSGFVVVQDARIKYINQAFLDMLGHEDKKEILGHPYGSVLADEVMERDLQFHRERMNGDAPTKEYDTKLIHKDGSIREVQVRVRRTDWEGRPASLIIMNDVTELRKLQREREQFFRYMVHELRAPLSPISTALTLLRQDRVLEDKRRLKNLVALLGRSADRLESFVKDFLELSRIHEQKLSIKQQPIDLRVIVEEEVENQRILAEDKGLSLEVEPWDEFPVSGDDFVVNTCVRNLVNNAIKYTDEGHVKVSVCQEDDSFRIQVADTGGGLTEKEQENIFQEFGQIKRTSGMKGTGLGLALVKKLVEASGGTVRVESEGEGKGSTFVVELPKVFGDPNAQVD
jgi:PAS domain S-box-containing protein